MVAVFNKELLSWYLITLKLKETVQSGLPKSPNTNPPPPLLLANAADPPTASRDTEWLIPINENLEQARHDEAACPWAKLSIYRMPQSLHDRSDDKAYAPQLVSLGPFHHGKRRLHAMDRHKWRALHHVLKRTGHAVNLYLDAVAAVEERTRACYDGVIKLSSSEFVSMMVLDGCFVLELFRGVAGEGFKSLGYARSDPVFAMRGTMHSIQRDMIMLENQIPLFLLDRLLGIQIGRPDQSGLVARLAICFFDPLMPTDEPLRQIDRARLESSSTEGIGRSGSADSSATTIGGGFADRSIDRSASAAVFDPLSDGGLHCLDVFRHSLLRNLGSQPAPRRWIRRWSHNNRGRVADKRRQQLIHCVTELREAGIKFRRRRTDRFWDIKFDNGVLKIPRILIHDGTKSLFLNLIAFEQCHMDCGNEITSYVIFMDNLINSEEDVGYLHYCGIIEHWLGNDDEVADLFNRLCQEVVFDINNSYLSALSDKVNRYYNHRWNAWRATLKHRYFNNPWAILSVIAAVVLLLLTSAQTFYGVFSYYRPSS